MRRNALVVVKRKDSTLIDAESFVRSAGVQMYDALEPFPLGIATITRPSPSLPMHEMEVEKLYAFIQVVGEATALPGPFTGKLESTVTPGAQFRKRRVVTLFGQDPKST